MSVWTEPGTEHDYYDRAPIVARPALRWPEGKALAVAIVVSAEYYELTQPADWFVPPNVPGLFGRGPYPDFGSFSRREYGNRVGIFRVMQALDACGLRATVAMDAHVATHYRVIVDECLRRNWEIAAHGKTVNRVISAHLSEAQERQYIEESLAAVALATGKSPRGWHGPEYGESARTPTILASLGVDYLLDWPNDEQPYAMRTAAGSILSIPMAADLDDVNAHWHRRISMERWRVSIGDAVERLAADGRTNGRMLVLNLHPWLIGHPFRTTYLEEALALITGRPDVWLTTTGAIADWVVQGKGMA